MTKKSDPVPMTLRVPAKLHAILKEMANARDKSMQKTILFILEEAMEDYKEILDYETKMLKGVTTPCQHCDSEVSFFDLKKRGTCPKCGKRVRVLRPIK